MIANVKEIKKKKNTLKTDHGSFNTSEFPIYRGVVVSVVHFTAEIQIYFQKKRHCAIYNN